MQNVSTIVARQTENDLHLVFECDADNTNCRCSKCTGVVSAVGGNDVQGLSPAQTYSP